MKVLLVEDDPIALRLLERIISAQQHEVHSFADAEEAWEAYQRQHYPLLVLDWMLPGMNGLDLCREVRNHPQGPFSVVLVVTALTTPQDLESVLEAGADDYLAKPIERELLNVRLKIAERRVQNIEIHRAAEEQRRLLEAAVRSSEEGILITNAALAEEAPGIVYVNESLARMTGYGARELIGQPLSIFEGPETNPSATKTMLASLRNGQSYSEEVIHYKKDRTPIVVRWHIDPVRDALDRITHYVSVHQEITEQRRLEQELVEISEREQRNIGRDLHDGLGQELTGLAFMTRSLERKLREADSDSAHLASELSNLVDSAKKHTRDLAHGLVTVDLHGNGIRMALENLISKTEQYAGIECDFSYEVDLPWLDETIAMHLYRICQEALTNVLRHSGATSVTVRVYREDGQIHFCVQDNGRGVTENGQAKEGMGLRIMAFRARIINASLKILPGEACGTRVLCSIIEPRKRIHT